MLFKSTVAVIAMVCLSFQAAEAHVSLLTPCGRYRSTSGCPAPPPGQSIDYNINSPIGTKDSIASPICKHTVPYTQRTVYRAGQTIQTSYAVGAPHSGGHCQWALSYDNGQTWVVIKTMLRECFRTASGGQAYSVPVTIPANAPSGKVTFQWIWNNAVGNRELYSNCADIEIQGSNGGTLSGVAPLFANYGKGSVVIPEFGGPNSPDMREAFDRRPPVTITVPASRA